MVRSPDGARSSHDNSAREPPQPRARAATATTAALTTFLSPRTPASATTKSQTQTSTPTPVCHSRPAIPSPPIARRAARKLPRAMPAMRAGVVLSTGDGDSLAGVGGVSLWLDMRTSPLPAAQTLRALYDDLRDRELALGRSPDDPDWALRRVPNPVGALLYASESGGRPAEEMKALGGALPCFQLGNDSNDVLEVPSGDVVGVGIDPVEGGESGGAGAGPAMAAVAAAQQIGGGDFVVLRGVRPSAWEGADMTTVLQIAVSACAGSGKTLVVSVRSVGQLHDAAMAALAASQTQVLGRGVDEGPETGATVVLLIEPVPELWEAGLLYL